MLILTVDQARSLPSCSDSTNLSREQVFHFERDVRYAEGGYQAIPFEVSEWAILAANPRKRLRRVA